MHLEKSWGVLGGICITVDPGKSHRELLDICGSSLTCQDLKQLLSSSFNYKFYFFEFRTVIFSDKKGGILGNATFLSSYSFMKNLSTSIFSSYFVELGYEI